MSTAPPGLDPITNIILGVIANGLTTLIAHLWRQGSALFTSEKHPKRLLSQDASLNRTLQLAAASVARGIDLSETRQAERVKLFLVSPDVEAIVRHMYASQLISDQRPVDVESLRAEFLASLQVYVDVAPQQIRVLSHDLFNALFAGCERALLLAIQKGSLAAHEAKSALRQRLILDELEAIQKGLALLRSGRKPDIVAINDFERKYRTQVGERHGSITPPHFDAARKLPINDLYVAPSVVTTPRRKGEEPLRLKSPDFLAQIYRAVLLGNPGGGKSTFVQKLCHDLAAQHEERLLGGRLATPVLVILREYGAEKKSRPLSILQYIETTANSRYQVMPPPGAFEYLLLNGRVVVLFDGLDELLDTAYRVEVSADVQSFCSLYPTVPVLVTSREVGYEQAPLDEKRFEVFRLAPFDEEEVREYASKWFAADADLTRQEQRLKATAFLEESGMVADLRSNPLMLALMCNIYRGENYIPRNRPDVYEKCAVMLFERWDKRRGIMVPLPFEAHLRHAMEFLAWWIYSDEALQSGVSERELILKTAEYLGSWVFEDRVEAEAAARKFIEFCSGRAWVFTDTGSRREGEPLFQFTHRTFLEYFAAAHLVRTKPTPDALGEVLEPRIERREWDVVSQLAFQLQNRNVEGAGDLLLMRLVERGSRPGDGEGLNCLSFGGRCLEFIVPRPRTVREIVTACVRRSLRWGIAELRKGERRTRRIPQPHLGEAIELVGPLMRVAAENRLVVSDTIQKMVVDVIQNGSDEEALLGIELGMNLVLAHHFPIEARRDKESLRLWSEVSNRIRSEGRERIQAMCAKYVFPCVEGVWRGTVTLQDFVRWHGVEKLFVAHTGVVFPVTWWSSVADYLLSGFFLEEESEARDRLRVLAEVGTILLGAPTPWVGSLREEVRFGVGMLHRAQATKKMGLSAAVRGDEGFGLFCLMAVMVEVHGGEKDLPERLGLFSRLESVQGMLLARLTTVEADRLESEIARSGFTESQAGLVRRWARREVDFVSGSSASQRIRARA